MSVSDAKPRAPGALRAAAPTCLAYDAPRPMMMALNKHSAVKRPKCSVPLVCKANRDSGGGACGAGGRLSFR